VNEVADPKDMRSAVERMEAILEQYPQAECPLQHKFAPGVYIREMLVPAGVIATGAVHKTEHVTIVIGHCLLTTDEGPKEFSGYSSFVSKPGAKRAIQAIQDTIVTTIHPTEETDLDKLCELLTESKSDELLGGANNRQLLANGKKAEALK
jgi:hypothetical protein